MQLISEKACPLCGDERIRDLMTCPDCLTHRGSFRVAGCETCGFRFLNPYPSRDDIGVFYAAEDYVPVSNTTKGWINKGYHLARRIMLRAKRGLVTRHSRRVTGRLLDIGCGTGEFAGYMLSSGWEAQGVEPCKPARESAQKRFGLPVADVSEQPALPDGHYDVITLWHALEHAHDLNHSMREVSRLLAPDGTVFIGVPNHACYDAEYYGAHWAAYDAPRHLYHFVPDTLRRLADKHGFTVTALLPLLFDPLYIPLLTEKGREDGSYLRGLYVAAISFFQSLMDAERCSAVTYVLRKKQAGYVYPVKGGGQDGGC